MAPLGFGVHLNNIPVKVQRIWNSDKYLSAFYRKNQYKMRNERYLITILTAFFLKAHRLQDAYEYEIPLALHVYYSS